MPCEKSINFRKPSQRFGLVTPARANMESLPPLFPTIKLRKTIERLLPVEHHQRLRQYFDIYGRLRCSRSSVVYGANGFCMLCISMIGKRMRKVDKELQARKPALRRSWKKLICDPTTLHVRCWLTLFRRLAKGQFGENLSPNLHPKST
jgi:hypothetical protein